MARAAKEAVVVVIDTSASMAEPYSLDDGSDGEEEAPPSKLEVAKEIATLLLADRAIEEQGKKARCEAGLVAFGTDDTMHPLQDLGDEYAHMVEVFPLEGLHAANFARTMALRPAKPGVEGDVLSGIIAAFTMLQERTATRKVDRRIVVITDGQSRIQTADGLDTVVKGLTEFGVSLSVVGFDFPPATNSPHATAAENARMLQSIAHVCLGDDASQEALSQAVQEARPFLKHWGAHLRKRAVSANVNVACEFTPRLAFSAQTAAITMLARPPSLKLSAKDDPSNKKLTQERRYVDAEEGPASAEVAPHERVRGFLYGGEVLPVDQAAEEALKWAEEEEVAVRLITFLPAAQAPRWLALSNALALKPHAKEGNPTRVALFFSSLGQALRETGHVALVRYNRTKKADPEIGILAPPSVQLSPDQGDILKLPASGEAPPPYLVYVKMPFHEDVRKYSFRPLDSSNMRHYPTEEEKATALALVDALTLPADPATGSRLRLAPHPGIRAVWRSAVAQTVAKGVEMEEEEGEEPGEEPANPLGRQNVLDWAAGLRQGQEGGEGGGAWVAVPFRSFVPGEEELPKEMRPDPGLWARAEGALKRFREALPLEAQEPRQKKQTRTWADVGGAEYDAAASAAPAAAADAAAIPTEAVLVPAAVKEEEPAVLTGASMPMEEERESMEENDVTYAVPGKAVPEKLDRGNLEESLALMLGAGGEHKDRALKQLEEMLELYLKRAEDGQTSFYKQARAALQALRQASETAQRPPEEFNTFMRGVVKRRLCHGGGGSQQGGELWRLLKEAGVTLRGVCEAEARAFLEEAEEEAAPAAPAPVAAPMEEEDEFEIEG